MRRFIAQFNLNLTSFDVFWTNASQRFGFALLALTAAVAVPFVWLMRFRPVEA